MANESLRNHLAKANTVQMLTLYLQLTPASELTRAKALSQNFVMFDLFVAQDAKEKWVLVMKEKRKKWVSSDLKVPVRGD